MNHVLAIADALVLELNDGAFELQFEAERIYQLPAGAENEALDYYDSLRVFVMPAATSTSLVARDCTEDVHTVHVGVLKRVEKPLAPDPLMALVGEIKDWLRFRHLDLDEDVRASWQSVAIDPLFDQQRLIESRLFASVIAVTYRLHRGA